MRTFFKALATPALITLTLIATVGCGKAPETEAAQASQTPTTLFQTAATCAKLQAWTPTAQQAYAVRMAGSTLLLTHDGIAELNTNTQVTAPVGTDTFDLTYCKVMVTNGAIEQVQMETPAPDPTPAPSAGCAWGSTCNQAPAQPPLACNPYQPGSPCFNPNAGH